MNRTEALRQIEAYLEGSLAGPERLGFETIVRQDEMVFRALEHAKELNRMLVGQPWLEPSVGFTQSIIAEVGLLPALEESDKLESLFTSQTWLTPSSAFTQMVMEKAGLSGAQELATETKRELYIEWLHGLAPAAAIIAFVIMFGKELWGCVLGCLHTSGVMLDSITGTRIFEQQPLIQLGIIVPLLGSVIISAMVTRRLRLSS